jgi:putative membrane protein
MYLLIQQGSFAAITLAALFSGAALAAAPQTEATAFVSAAAQAGMTEVAAARQALVISKNEAVRSFASRMITDHEKAHAELMQLATSKRIPFPAALDAPHAKMVEALRGKTGRTFDTAYAKQMVLDHAQAVELFQANIAHPDGEVAAFAARTLSVLQEHKRLADNLDANLKK